MPLKTLSSLDLTGKRVFVRVDFNVPLVDGVVGDDTRIREVLPTIKELIKAGAKVILGSHLGRPKGKVVPEYSLLPVAQHLEKLLKVKVVMAQDCVGAEVEKLAKALPTGGVLLLENLRFHAEEEKNDPAFAAKLAKLADVFVQEAFGTAHRAHASTAGIAEHLPAVAGLLLEREIKALDGIFTKPARPLVLIMGGAKIDTKLGILQRFVDLADQIILGGGIANTFLAAEGFEVGGSLYEPDKVELAQEILMRGGDKIILPTDVIAADGDATPSDTTPTIDVHIEGLPFNMKIYDIGKETRDNFAEIIAQAGTIIWNGPVGFFEKKPFSGGTRLIAESCALSQAQTILGGGDTLEALKRFGIAQSKFTHVSTGGGAMLEFLEGKKLPGIEVVRK
jgi:phosphoglycerate kinase